MAITTLFLNTPDLAPEDYCVFGLATCFVRDEGEIKQVQVIEPIPSSALEALFKGVPTSYQVAWGKSLAEFFDRDVPAIPPEFPPEAMLCDNFAERTIAAARTYKSHPHAQAYIDQGTKKEDFNYSLERKRVLNAANVVRTEDNVKQHPHTHKVL